MRWCHENSTVLASTTPRGLPKFPSGSVNTRNTVTSKLIGRPYDCAPRAPSPDRSGGAAFAGALGLQHGNAGVDRTGDGLSAAAGAEQFAKGGLVVLRGLGGIDEALDDLDETVRIVVEREMPGALENLQLGTWHRSMLDPGMTDRHHHVMGAPNDLHRNRLCQITSVQHGDHLAAPVHHRPQCPGKRRGGHRLR